MPTALLILLAIGSLAAGEVWSPPTPAAAQAALIDMLRSGLAAGPLRVRLAIIGTGGDFEVVAVDARRVSLAQGGAVLPLPWERLERAQVAAIGLAGARGAAPATLVVADWLLAAGDAEAASEVLQRKTDWPKERIADVALRSAWIRGRKPAPSAPAAPAGGAAPARAVDCSLPGISRRFGPDWASLHPGADPAKGFPQVPLAPERKTPKGDRSFQIGAWTDDVGDYSSAQGQIGYVPDAGGMGIDRVTILRMDNGCFTEKPEVPWWGGWRPEPHTAAWGGRTGGVPLAICRGAGQWSNCAVVLFPDGLIATTGTCTAFGSDPVLQLPPGKVPTALAVTPRNEFALVTVVDSASGKGQVAVIALTSHKPGFAHDWQQPHPGLPSVAMLTGLKLLGFIDAGMDVPDLISAAAPYSGGRLSHPTSGHIGSFKDFDLGEPAGRASFLDGGNAHYVSRCGWAVVGSTGEGKVSFIDLQPLFERCRAMYFASEADYRKTRDQGDGPGQWPYAFAHDRTMEPKPVRTVRVKELSALIALLPGGERARALLAARDGTVESWAVGGLATAEPAIAADIVKKGSLKVGANPCSFAHLRGGGDTVIAVCRGDRELAWVKTAPGPPPQPPANRRRNEPWVPPPVPDLLTVVRRLRDARLIDPVACEQAETHGIETALLTVCDFAGRQILNYRWSEVVFATQGGARYPVADGKAEFECGGVMAFPGAPFIVSACNVN